MQALVFRPPPAERYLLATCSALFGILAVAILGALLPLQALEILPAVFATAGIVVLAALIWLVLSETYATFRLRIEIGFDSVTLRLPRRRGHVRLPAFEGSLPLASVDFIESRSEAFRQLGMIAIQRAYRLVLKDGRTVELGADRQFKAPLFGRAAEAVAERSGVRLRQGGMVDGNAGLLAAAGTSVPPWNAPTLSAAEAGQRMEHSARAFRYIGVFVLIMTLLRFFTRR